MAGPVDKAKINSRINRFGKQGMSEGNMHVRKKLSIAELVKSVVSVRVMGTCFVLM